MKKIRHDFPKGMEHSMLPWLGRTMKCIDIYIAQVLSGQGIQLTRHQMVMMKILQSHGPQPQSDLAFLTERDKGSLTRLVSSMEKKNLVARIASQEDKRVNMVHITKTGEKVLKDMEPVLQKIMKNLQDGIAKEDRDVVVSVMKKIQENIDKQL
jgi:DNA-binding MarR family transcriptional regulator